MAAHHDTLEATINDWAKPNYELRDLLADLKKLATTDKEQASTILADNLLESAGVDLEGTYSADSIVTVATRKALYGLDWDLIRV